MLRSLSLVNNISKPTEFIDKALLERGKKIQAQQAYCEEHRLPNFVTNGRCFGCGVNVFDFVTLKEASSSLITGCNHCHYSFCE